MYIMKSVLLIDGSSLFQGFLRDKVAAEQVKLECASGREAYTKMLSLLPDLVIIEIETAITEDINLLLEKKHIDPNAKKIPGIIKGTVKGPLKN